MATFTARAGQRAVHHPPVPTTRNCAGLEAGSSGILIARVRRHDTREDWSFTALSPPSTLKNGAGSTGLSLRRIARTAGLGRESAVCAMSSPEIDVFPLSLQPKESEPIDALVVSHARKLLSVPLKSVVLDYVLLPDWVKRPTDETTPILVFSASREAVEELLEHTERIGFQVARLLTPACALAPAVAGAAPDTRHLVIATSEDSTSISVVQDGRLLLERIVRWGPGQLIELLRAELDLQERQCRALLARWNESPNGGAPSGRDPGLDEALEGAARDVLAPTFRELTSEAAGCLGYCGSFLRHAVTSEVVLVGPMANHSLLRDSLEAELGLPILGPEEGLALGLMEADAEAATYATAAACALWRDEEST